MATIRKRGAKWQVQIRRIGFPAISRSFHIRKDAEAWARQKELEADRCELPSDPRALQRIKPLSRLQLSGPSERRKRRLRKGELEVTAPTPCTTTFT
jgi:hypothetical protein